MLRPCTLYISNLHNLSLPKHTTYDSHSSPSRLLHQIPYRIQIHLTRTTHLYHHRHSRPTRQISLFSAIFRHNTPSLLPRVFMVYLWFHIRKNTVIVSWIPQYHDNDHIESYLGTLYCGGKGILHESLEFRPETHVVD